MTDEERKALTEFVLDRKDQLEIAQAIHECWPEVKQRVVEGFYEVLWEAEGDYVDYDDWRRDWGYSDRQTNFRGKCYWEMFKEKWSLHSGSRASIRLENYDRGPNGWFIGVYSPVAITRDEGRRQCYEHLRDELNHVAGTETPEDHWPWWIWVKEEYRNWDSIIPALNEEARVRGEITNYLVDMLVRITKIATPIIDKVEA